MSNELGAGRPRAARLAVGIVLGMAITEGVVIGLVLLLIRNIWGYAYTNEIDVVAYVAAMMPIIAASNFMDGLQCILSGTKISQMHNQDPILYHDSYHISRNCKRHRVAEDRSVYQSWSLLSCRHSFGDLVSFRFAYRRKGMHIYIHHAL